MLPVIVQARRHMDIVVNGEHHEMEEPLTVAQLLQKLNLRTEQVAVEINLKILDRGDFPTWHLHHGDKVEILSFIGGGSPNFSHEGPTCIRIR